MKYKVQPLKHTKEYQYGFTPVTYIDENGKRVIKIISSDYNYVEIDLVSLLSDLSNMFPELYNAFSKE